MEVDGVAEVLRVIEATRSPKIKKKVSPKGIPENVTMDEILKSLPKEVFTQDRVKAYGSLVITLLTLSFSVYILARAPWFLWPIAWIIGGASITGLFAIGHDCVHRSFAKSKIVNDIVGTILMLPMGYSYEAWKTCHRYQNGGIAATSNAFVNEIWSWAKGRTFWLASLAHWAQQHFDISYYKPEDRLRIRISNIGVYAFGIVFFSIMFWYTGLIGIIKFWLLPMLGYHVLISTTTLLPTVVLDEKSASTLVHLSYPKWLEFLTNDISITLPRGVSTSIPHYKLRQAYQYLKQQWGQYFLEVKFDWELVTELIDKSVEKEEFEPLPLKPLSASGEVVNQLKASGEINPVPQTPQGVAGWANSAKAFLANINWLHTSILSITPALAFYGLYTHTPSVYTLIFAAFYYFLCGMGITAGYHRLWAHRAYKAKAPTKIALLLLGSAAVEGSVRWWCRDHRAHHRYTDTDRDPYNANRGFWYSHIGWMLVKQDPTKIGRATIEDLNADPWIRWQHKYYVFIAFYMSIVIPTLICSIWGDFWGGFYYAAMFRQFLVHHNTFMVNSLAHFWGLAPFADEHTPRDSIVTALLTFGEGYHNFHHEFPYDYRNAIKFYQYDPTKWVIKALSYIGQTYDLKVFDDDIVKKGQVQMKQKELDKIKATIDWGMPVGELPVITRAVFDKVQAKGYKLIIINDAVHDVTEFVSEHPGGPRYIEAYAGKDGTKAFEGTVYYHSNAARNVLNNYRIGLIAKDDDWNFAPAVIVEPTSYRSRNESEKKSN
jgi:stearoyl-CoA desaturase (delta-9 desaturase)